MVAFDLHRLRLLRELAERGTMSAVANALGYSPSAVSQQLTVLEREVGVPLLEKAGRGVRLTDAAHLLAQHAGVLLAAAEAAQADLASLTGDVRGTVRAGGLQSATRHLLIPALAATMTEHSRVRVEISEIELEQALPELRLGTIDLVVSDEYDGHPRPRPAGVRFALLHEERLRLVLPAAHPRAGDGRPVPLSALRDDVWAASDRGTGHHAVVVGTCRDLGGFEPDLRHRSNDVDVQLELIRRTGAIGLLPAMTLPADPGLAVRDVAGAVVGRRLLVAVRDRPSAPALRAFLAALRAEAGRLALRAAPGVRADPGGGRRPAPSPPAPGPTAPSTPV